MFDLFTRVQQLEQEVRQLRGEVEQLRYERQSENRTVIEEMTSPITLEPPPSPGDFGSTPTTSTDAEELETERAELDEARNLLRNNQTQAAIEKLIAFESVYSIAFTQRYSVHRDRGEALYWLGEAHYIRREFEEAEAVLSELRRNHSRAPEMPMALLRLGNLYEALDQPADAREAYRQLVNEYPTTPASQRATQRLSRLGE